MELSRQGHIEAVRNLHAQIAHLEMENDQLTAEIHDIDQMLRQVGFEGGLAALKQAVLEVIEGGSEESA